MDRLKSLIILGALLGAAESLLIPPILPFRIGLANVATLAAVLTHGLGGGLLVTVSRSLAVAVLTGGAFSLSTLFSLGGGVASALVMYAFSRLPISNGAVSGAGGMASGAVQTGIFALLGEMPGDVVLDLLPVFLGWGLVSGTILGILADHLFAQRRRSAHGSTVSPPG